MKTKKINIRYTIMGFLAVIFLCSSCSSPTVKTNFSHRNYDLSVETPTPDRMAAYVIFKGSTLNGHPLYEDSVRSLQLKKGVHEFGKLLEKSGLFKSVEIIDIRQNRYNEILIEVSFVEEEDDFDVVGGAFLGLLSLSISGSLTLDYTFSSEMRMKASINGLEVLLHSSMKSAVARGTHNRGGKYPEEWTLTKKLITDENNKDAVHFLVTNSDKFK